MSVTLHQKPLFGHSSQTILPKKNVSGSQCSSSWKFPNLYMGLDRKVCGHEALLILRRLMSEALRNQDKKKVLGLIRQEVSLKKGERDAVTWARNALLQRYIKI
jgi:hypothetical protein